METLKIKDIIIDDSCQLRAAGSDATVADYTEALIEGATFPPVTVFQDGDRYYLADGFHRIEAHKAAGLTEVSAEIRVGTMRDAIAFAAGANSNHGLRRTQADKRKAITTFLTDDEWKQWSDSEIARRTRTSDKTVAKLRRELSGEGANSEIRVEERKFISKHGTEATRRVQTGGETVGMMDRVLRGLSDEVLLAEVVRRGLMEVNNGV